MKIVKTFYIIYISLRIEILKKIILKEGKDESVMDGSEVFIHYKTKEDDSTFVKSQYFTFKIGEQQALKFFEICVKTMKVGEKAEFILNSNSIQKNEQNIYHLIPGEISSTFQIELLNIINHKKKLSDMNYKGNLAKVKKLKEKGVEKYKSGDIPLAKKLFKKAIIYLEDNINEIEGIELYSRILSYLCNCFIKQKEYYNVINFASKGLKIKELPILYYSRAIAYANNEE